MKKLFTLFTFTALSVSCLYSSAQGIKKETKDPDVYQMEANRKTATPFMVYFNESTAFKESDAQSLFTKYLSLRGGADELRESKRETTDDIAVTRYYQYFKGVRVEQGSYTVTSKNGRVAFIMGDFFNVDAAASVTPSITEANARVKALASQGGNFADNSTEIVFSEDFAAPVANGKVMLAYKFLMSSADQHFVFNYVYIDANNGKLLGVSPQTMTGCFENKNPKSANGDAVKMLKRSFASTPKKEALGTEACSPTVVSPLAASIYSGTLTNMVTRFTSGSYRLEATLATENYPTHTKNINHALVTTFATVGDYTTAMSAAPEVTDADNNWTSAEYNNANRDNTAFDAYWGSQRVYDYWKNIHGRLSWDNSNGVLNSFVHGDVNWDNAFWQGGGGINSMFYGDGSNVANRFSTLTALDVTGHEIGHGVCQNTANLTYAKESGAMNEGFSDIWGACIERNGDPHESDAVAKSYFDIGEEIGLPYPNSPLRSMSNPKSEGQPDTYGGTNWVSVSPCTPTNGNDQCGVHTNSGVLNKWFYLMVSGGSGTNDVPNAYIVGALGWSKAEKVAYLTELNLTASSDYTAARTASIAAATTLYGPACSVDVENVTRAWYAVGVGANWVQCTPQVGFKNLTATVTETSGSTACPASKTLTVPMQVIPGLVPAGGNATVTVTATGTAVNGQDYTFATGTATFNAGSTTDQNITLNILEDGAVESPETIILDFSITANGSNISKSGVYLQEVITITDDDAAPSTGNVYVSVPIGSSTTTSNTSTPFRGLTAAGRTQAVILASELTAAGLSSSRPITGLSLTVTTKNSTIAYTGFTISIGHTTNTSVAGTVTTGFTQVYSGNYSTVAGVNTFTLSPAFTWDGVNNLIIQMCFTNAAAGAGNDDVAINLTTGNRYGYVSATSGGCAAALSSATNGRPVFTFIQQIPPSAIEITAASTRSYQVSTGQSTYFYSTADGQLIAGITGNNKDLGCVSATVNTNGAGFPTLTGYPSAKRSAKEVTITPTTNVATTNYNVTLYYTDAELTGVTPANLFLLKTTAATDAGITAANTSLHTPTMGTASNYKSFSSSFTGFSRFFLVDNAFIVVALKDITAEAFLSNGYATIQWKTSQEINSSYFIIERSYDGNNFTEIKRINAAGNSSIQKQYAAADADPVTKKTFYRIRMVHNDGSFLVSNIVSVKSSSEPGITIMPNPAKDNITIRYDHAGKGMMNIIDATGRKIKSLTVTGSSGSINLDISAWKAGVYLLTFPSDDGRIITEKFIKE